MKQTSVLLSRLVRKESENMLGESDDYCCIVTLCWLLSFSGMPLLRRRSQFFLTNSFQTGLQFFSL